MSEIPGRLFCKDIVYKYVFLIIKTEIPLYQDLIKHIASSICKGRKKMYYLLFVSYNFWYDVELYIQTKVDT